MSEKRKILFLRRYVGNGLVNVAHVSQIYEGALSADEGVIEFDNRDPGPLGAIAVVDGKSIALAMSINEVFSVLAEWTAPYSARNLLMNIHVLDLLEEDVETPSWAKTRSDS
jgi:hypothetical protein